MSLVYSILVRKVHTGMESENLLVDRLLFKIMIYEEKVCLPLAGWEKERGALM